MHKFSQKVTRAGSKLYGEHKILNFFDYCNTLHLNQIDIVTIFSTGLLH